MGHQLHGGRGTGGGYQQSLFKIIATLIRDKLADVFREVPALLGPTVPDEASVAEEENAGYGEAAACTAFGTLASAGFLIIRAPGFPAIEKAPELPPE